MPLIGRAISRPPTFDHQANSFDVTVDLLLLDQDCAFVKEGDQITGIVCVNNLLGEFNSATPSEMTVAEFAEPLVSINECEHKSKAANLMKENNVEHIAVTNRNGDFVGIASAKLLKAES